LPEQELTLADQSPTEILFANFPEWQAIMSPGPQFTLATWRSVSGKFSQF
jgi:hypothetical protein